MDGDRTNNQTYTESYDHEEIRNEHENHGQEQQHNEQMTHEDRKEHREGSEYEAKERELSGYRECQEHDQQREGSGLGEQLENEHHEQQANDPDGDSLENAEREIARQALANQLQKYVSELEDNLTANLPYWEEWREGTWGVFHNLRRILDHIESELSEHSENQSHELLHQRQVVQTRTQEYAELLFQFNNIIVGVQDTKNAINAFLAKNQNQLQDYELICRSIQSCIAELTRDLNQRKLMSM